MAARKIGKLCDVGKCECVRGKKGEEEERVKKGRERRERKQRVLLLPLSRSIAAAADPSLSLLLSLSPQHELYNKGEGFFKTYQPTLGTASVRQQAPYASIETADWRVLMLDTGYGSYLQW